MKKQSIFRSAILFAALTAIAAVKTYAGNSALNPGTKNQWLKPLPPRDTPYMVTVNIVRTGKLDTPYLHTTVLYAVMQPLINNAMAQPGLYRVELLYYNIYNQPIGSDEYFIDNRNWLNAATAKNTFE